MYGLREIGSYWGAYYMRLFLRMLAMTSTLADKYFIYRHPGRKCSQRLVAEHEAQIAAAAHSLKKALRFSL